MSNVTAKSASAQGREAYERGQEISSNPFDRGSNRLDHFLWRQGWLLAHSEDTPAHMTVASNPAPTNPPNCGACPGDGTICKTACRHAEENPPAPTNGASHA